MDLRADLFPQYINRKYLSFILTETIQESTKLFSERFKSEDGLIEFINSMPDHFIAERLLDSLRAYLWLSHIEDVYSRLILRLAILENLNPNPYLQFPDWFKLIDETKYCNILKIRNFEEIKTFKDLQTIVLCHKEEYLNAHGSRRTIFNVFSTNFSINDQINFISSFVQTEKKEKYIFYLRSYVLQFEKDFPGLTQKLEKSQDIEKFQEIFESDGPQNFPLEQINEGNFPRCYNYRYCNVDHGNCPNNDDIPEQNKCRLLMDKELRERELKHCINILYQFRTDFVHVAKSGYSEGMDFLLTVVDGQSIMLRFKREKFDSYIRKSIINHFDSLKKNN